MKSVRKKIWSWLELLRVQYRGELLLFLLSYAGCYGIAFHFMSHLNACLVGVSGAITMAFLWEAIFWYWAQSRFEMVVWRPKHTGGLGRVTYVKIGATEELIPDGFELVVRPLENGDVETVLEERKKENNSAAVH